MVFSEVNDDWNKHWESFLFVVLKDIEEVVILEEAHSSIGNLKMDTTNTLNDSLEKFDDKSINLIDFTDFENFLQFSQEKCFFDRVSEWPISQKSFEKWKSQSSIFSQEEHRASKQLLVELGACLHFM